DACGRVARRIGKVLLIALDFELGDLGDRSLSADVPDETVDLAGGELTLPGGEPPEVLRRNLSQTLRVDFLYDSTSRGSVQIIGSGYVGAPSILGLARKAATLKAISWLTGPLLKTRRGLVSSSLMRSSRSWISSVRPFAKGTAASI